MLTSKHRETASYHPNLAGVSLVFQGIEPIDKQMIRPTMSGEETHWCGGMAREKSCGDESQTREVSVYPGVFDGGISMQHERRRGEKEENEEE